MLADAGLIVSELKLPALTVRLAAAVLPLSLPVTVCAPATVAVQVAPVHEPSGLIVKVVELVTAPRLLPYASEPIAVKLWLPPEVMLADAGLIVSELRLPAFTVRLATAVLPLLVPVTVCAPATVAVQPDPVHEPSGLIEKAVPLASTPFPYWSKP
jgi:hypothetical protein